MLFRFPLPLAIFVVFVVLLTMSIVALWAKRPVNQIPGNEFAEGFQEGFAVSAVADTLVSALIFGVIAGFRRTRFTVIGAFLLVVLSALHLQRYTSTFPQLSDGLLSLAPKVASNLLLSPFNWVCYFIIYRAYYDSTMAHPLNRATSVTNEKVQEGG